MRDEEKIFEKLDEVIKKKKEEIEGLRKLIGSIENPTDPNNKEELEKDVTQEEAEQKKKQSEVEEENYKELNPE